MHASLQTESDLDNHQQHYAQAQSEAQRQVLPVGPAAVAQLLVSTTTSVGVSAASELVSTY
jgi:hypothetical protein